MKDKIVKILRWPENKRTGVVPWFVILRRLVFYGVVMLGLFISTIGMFGMFGAEEARQFWRENR